MGESKRRKQLLGEDYGKPDNLEISHPDYELVITLRYLKYSGTIDICKEGLFISCDDEYTDSEKEFIGSLYTMLLPTMIEFYGVENVNLEYKFIADFSKTKTSKSAMIDFYPSVWDELAFPRNKRRAKMLLKDIENVVKSISEKRSPEEHTRKAHKRRVYYGKGKKFCKWVNIAETTVNKGHRRNKESVTR
ncbi:MAG: hypothetical protein AAF378_05115 [Cyanobacteria bacterium P01_A01_bin.84]